MAVVQFEIDTESWQIKSVNGVPVGECNKCGKCCIEARPECAAENLIAETWDGVPVMRCKLHGPNKPVSCVMWPILNVSELPEDCTMRTQE